MIDFATAQTRLSSPSMYVCAQTADVTVSNSKPFCYRIATFRARSNFRYQFGRVLGAVVRFTERLGAVLVSVKHVAMMRIPTQVGGNVTRRVAILMASLTKLSASTKNECLSNQSMHPKGLFLSNRDNEFQLHMAAPHRVRGNNPSNPSTFSGCRSPYAAKAADFVVRGSRDGFPNFNGIGLGISHRASPHDVGGQGRRGVPPPFRPAISSRIPGKREAA